MMWHCTPDPRLIPSGVHPDAFVHCGFQDLWQDTTDKIMEKIVKYLAEYDVEMILAVGHSLGELSLMEVLYRR